jgi:hypothetical protein
VIPALTVTNQATPDSFEDEAELEASRARCARNEDRLAMLRHDLDRATHLVQALDAERNAARRPPFSALESEHRAQLAQLRATVESR